MNKKIFLKLGIGLVCLSLVACGQKNNSEGEEDSSKSSSSNSVITTQNSGGESINTTSPPIENLEDNNHQNVNQDKQSDIEQDIQEESAEDEYYIIIKDAWQKQRDYIESIDDAKVKQSIQTSRSAAIMESNRLLIEHPEDSDAINSSLKRVLNGE